MKAPPEQYSGGGWTGDFYSTAPPRCPRPSNGRRAVGSGLAAARAYFLLNLSRRAGAGDQQNDANETEWANELEARWVRAPGGEWDMEPPICSANQTIELEQ